MVGIQSVPIFFLSFFFLTSYPCLEPKQGAMGTHHSWSLSECLLLCPAKDPSWLFSQCSPHAQIPTPALVLSCFWSERLGYMGVFNLWRIWDAHLLCVFSACTHMLCFRKQDLEIYCRWRDWNIISCWPVAPNWHQEGTGSYYLGSGHHPSNLLPPYTDVFLKSRYKYLPSSRSS